MITPPSGVRGAAAAVAGGALADGGFITPAGGVVLPPTIPAAWAFPAAGADDALGGS